MIQIQVPINWSKINKEIQSKYQIMWGTQFKTIFFKSIEPNVKNIQIINMQNKAKNMHLLKLGLHNSGLCDFLERT